MRFEPRLPAEGINGGLEHPLKEAAVLVGGLSVLFAVLFVGLIWFVDIVVTLVPVRAEARTFAAWGLDGLADGAGEPRVAAAERLLARLARHWPDAPYEFRLGFLPVDAPNALALPGGLIAVTRGLLDEVETENELALVLGHELGHFHHRDHLRQLGRGVVVGVALAVLSNAADSRLQLGDVVADLTSRSFGRDQERMADRFGLGLVAAEFGHVAGAWAFFERLRAAGKGHDGLVAYLATHPGNRERIDDLELLAAERAWPTAGPLTPLVCPDCT